MPTTLLGERDDVVLLVFGDECLFETAKAVDGLLVQMGQQGVAFPGIVSLLRDLRLTCFPVIVYRSGLTKGTGVLSGARRIDVTMSITRIPL